jgi:hypothetical protein
MEIKASTMGAMHDVAAPCAADAGADVFYKFSVSKRVFVYADTFGASWNTVLFLASSTCAAMSQATMPGDSVCNDDACGTEQSQIVALLNPGTYYLGLSGRGSAQGDATIHFEWTLAGSGTATALPAGASVHQGTTSGSGSITSISADCVAAGPEAAYWWASCPADAGGQLTASTCDGTSWESVLEVEIPQSAPYACSLDGCGLQASIAAAVPAGAGLRVLAVDGQSGQDHGPYQLNVSRP